MTDVHPDGLAANWFSCSDLYRTVHGDTQDPEGPHSFEPELTPDGNGVWPQPDYEVVQRAGEIIVFPGHWWHQTYHYTVTLGCAGQYCNRRNLGQVLGHVLKWCGVDPARAEALQYHLASKPV